jgi:hypothetical protein
MRIRLLSAIAFGVILSSFSSAMAQQAFEEPPTLRDSAVIPIQPVEPVPMVDQNFTSNFDINQSQILLPDNHHGFYLVQLRDGLADTNKKKLWGKILKSASGNINGQPADVVWFCWGKKGNAAEVLALYRRVGGVPTCEGITTLHKNSQITELAIADNKVKAAGLPRYKKKDPRLVAWEPDLQLEETQFRKPDSPPKLRPIKQWSGTPDVKKLKIK